MTLKEHRELIKDSNGLITTEEFVRIVGTVKNHLKKCGAVNLRNKINEVRLFVEYIAETQECKPFFWINSKLPFCWNNPGDWDKYKYIRFQWGHLEPNNSNIVCDQFENLCLQSARCNNQIQSSMPLADIKELFYGSKTYDRILEIEDKRKILFDSDSWKGLVYSLKT